MERNPLKQGISALLPPRCLAEGESRQVTGGVQCHRVGVPLGTPGGPKNLHGNPWFPGGTPRMAKKPVKIDILTGFLAKNPIFLGYFINPSEFIKKTPGSLKMTTLQPDPGCYPSSCWSPLPGGMLPPLRHLCRGRFFDDPLGISKNQLLPIYLHFFPVFSVFGPKIREFSGPKMAKKPVFACL